MELEKICRHDFPLTLIEIYAVLCAFGFVLGCAFAGLNSNSNSLVAWDSHAIFNSCWAIFSRHFNVGLSLYFTSHVWSKLMVLWIILNVSDCMCFHWITIVYQFGLDDYVAHVLLSNSVNEVLDVDTALAPTCPSTLVSISKEQPP